MEKSINAFRNVVLGAMTFGILTACASPTGYGRHPPPIYGNHLSEEFCGIQTSYTVTLRRFDTSEALQLLNTMSGKFACYSSHDLLPGRTSAIRKYEYVSRATPGKIEEWLNRALMDMSLDPDRDVEVVYNESEFILDKIVSRPRREPIRGGSRFK